MRFDQMGQVPDFMKLTSEEIWEKLIDFFEDDASFLTKLRHETKDEAINRFNSSDFDPDVGNTNLRVRYRHPNLLPYRRTADNIFMEESYRRAVEIIPKLKRCLEQREMSMEFVSLFGEFSYALGVIHSASWSNDVDDVGPLRAGARGGRPRLEKQKKWVAMCIIEEMNEGADREQAEINVARNIREGIIKAQRFTTDYNKVWYEGLLSNNQLKSTYSKKNFGDDELRSAAASDTDVPPLPPRILPPR